MFREPKELVFVLDTMLWIWGILVLGTALYAIAWHTWAPVLP